MGADFRNGDFTLRFKRNKNTEVSVIEKISKGNRIKSNEGKKIPKVINRISLRTTHD